MDPKTYQIACSRTECDQNASRVRMAGVGMGTPLGPMEDWLLPVRLNHSILGLTGEVGELAGCLEKWVYYGQKLDRLNLTEELGDCLWYIAQMCNTLGVDMADVMTANIAKLKARYPDKYRDELAAESGRNRDAEMEASLMAQGLTSEQACKAVENGYIDLPVDGCWDGPNTPPADRSGS